MTFMEWLGANGFGIAMALIIAVWCALFWVAATRELRRNFNDLMDDL